jgi:hypothetical protein
MNRFRSIVTAAVAVALSLTGAGVMAVPADGAATVSSSGTDVTDRSLGYMSVPADLGIGAPLQAGAGQAAKGDFAERPGCFGQVWPDISPECLAKVSGSVSPVRTVTLGYQVGDSTTVLVRTPAPEVASR